MKLHASGEDYLEAILVLQKKRGLVRSVDVARHMEVTKPSVCNGYRQISRRQKRFTSLEELSEAEMAQLAVYDRYPWEYTTFPIGGAVILIEDDRLAEALLGLSQEDREIFMMHWFLRMTDEQIAKYMDMARRTVDTRRHKAYRLLKELMGGEADE